MNPEDLDAGEDPKALAELTSGFEAAPSETTAPPATPASEGEKEPAPKATDDKEETPPAGDPPPPAAQPEFVQITKDQLALLEAAAAKTGDIEKQMAKAFGTIGNVQQVIRQLQEATPKGIEIALPDDVVAELEAEYPEIATSVRKSLEKALKGIRGTGGAPATDIDPDKLKTLVSEATSNLQQEALEDAHPDWRNIVGVPDEQGNINPEHPFRKWLATQSAEYQEKINSTNNAAVITRAIDKFLQTQTKQPPAPPATPKPDPQAGARRDRIKDAVQPKGDGGHPPSAKSETDEFAEGFRSG